MNPARPRHGRWRKPPGGGARENPTARPEPDRRRKPTARGCGGRARKRPGPAASRGAHGPETHPPRHEVPGHPRGWTGPTWRRPERDRRKPEERGPGDGEAGVRTPGARGDETLPRAAAGGSRQGRGKRRRRNGAGDGSPATLLSAKGEASRAIGEPDLEERRGQWTAAAGSAGGARNLKGGRPGDQVGGREADVAERPEDAEEWTSRVSPRPGAAKTGAGNRARGRRSEDARTQAVRPKGGGGAGKPSDRLRLAVRR
jgi:hypothetical protein